MVICTFIGIFWNIFRSILRRDWCPGWDSNPHSRELPPQGSVYTNFTTWATVEYNIKFC